MNREEYIKKLPKQAVYLPVRPPLLVHIRDLFKTTPTIYKEGYILEGNVPIEKTIKPKPVTKKKKSFFKKKEKDKEFISEKFKGV